MFNIKFHKPFIRKLAAVYLKGKYFKIYAINLCLFGMTFEIWKE